MKPLPAYSGSDVSDVPLSSSSDEELSSEQEAEESASDEEVRRKGAGGGVRAARFGRRHYWLVVVMVVVMVLLLLQAECARVRGRPRERTERHAGASSCLVGPPPAPLPNPQPSKTHPTCGSSPLRRCLMRWRCPPPPPPPPGSSRLPDPPAAPSRALAPSWQPPLRPRCAARCRFACVGMCGWACSYLSLKKGERAALLHLPHLHARPLPPLFQAAASMEIDSGAAAGPVLGPAQHRVMRAVASAVSTLAAEDTCKAVMEQNRRNALVGAVRWSWCGCSGGIGWLFLRRRLQGEPAGPNSAAWP